MKRLLGATCKPSNTMDLCNRCRRPGAGLGAKRRHLWAPLFSPTSRAKKPSRAFVAVAPSPRPGACGRRSSSGSAAGYHPRRRALDSRAPVLRGCGRVPAERFVKRGASCSKNSAPVLETGGSQGGRAGGSDRGLTGARGAEGYLRQNRPYGKGPDCASFPRRIRGQKPSFPQFLPRPCPAGRPS